MRDPIGDAPPAAEMHRASCKICGSTTVLCRGRDATIGNHDPETDCHPMKLDYIKLSSKGVEATGRYVPQAIWSYVALRILGWAAWLILSLAAGGSALSLAGSALRRLMM
jgi:hypothetical protein